MSEKMKFKKTIKKNSVMIPKDDIVKPNDFFELNFGGGYIPQRKLDRVLNRLRNAPIPDSKPYHLRDEEIPPPAKEIPKKPKKVEKVIEFNADQIIIGRPSSTLQAVPKTINQRKPSHVQGVFQT
jgi:hypothetical protein